MGVGGAAAIEISFMGERDFNGSAGELAFRENEQTFVLSSNEGQFPPAGLRLSGPSLLYTH